MKITIILILALFLRNIGYCQNEASKGKNFDSIKVSSTKCLDTLGFITSACPLGVKSFHVNVVFSHFDSLTNQVQVIGRVTESFDILSDGVPDVSIFSGRIFNNKIEDKIILGISTYDRFFYYNYGFFNIEYQLNSTGSIFFFDPNYFLIEIPMSALTSRCPQSSNSTIPQ